MGRIGGPGGGERTVGWRGGRGKGGVEVDLGVSRHFAGIQIGRDVGLFLGDPCRTICDFWTRRSLMDNPRDRQIDVVAPALPGETALLAVMEQSDRDVAAGRTVPLADVLAELDGVAARIEARLRARRA